MKCRVRKTIFTFIMTCIVFCLSTSLSSASNTLQPLTLQLQWKDQFEFAGFYAAKEKGFYKDVGLDVSFKPFDPDKDIIDEVLQGKADYGVSYSSVISRYLKGAPLIFVANFLKYSPLMLVSQESYTLPSDLKGKKVMGVSNELEAETIMMMFKKFNMGFNDVQVVSPTFNIQDFIDKKVDAMSVYATNEIYELVKSKVKFNVLNPSAYGIPSYELNLFTTQDELKNNPKRVADFRAASIKGWEYALKHKEELIELILNKYNTQHKTYEALQYEAKQIHDIMLPSLMPIGSIDPLKVELIAENFMELELVPKVSKVNFDRFIYHPTPQDLKLTDREKNYLQSKHEITYCSDNNWMPLSQIKEDKHIGIDADIIHLFSKKLKHNFKLIPAKNWEDAMNKAKTGQCSILTFAMDTPLRREHYNFTKTLIHSPLVLTTGMDKRFTDDIRELAHKPIGLVKGYSYKELLSYKYPYLQLIEVNNIEEGLAKVAKGELYGFIDILSVLGYAIEQYHFGAMKVSAKFDIDINLGYGVDKNDTLLLSILNKTIDTIDEGSRQEIINRWTNVNFSDESYNYSLITKIIITLLLLLIPLLYHYRKMKTLNAKLHELSYTDTLTQLYNRRYIEQCIEDEYSNNGDTHFSLILVDIDNFKNINDTYGHHYGDTVIIEISNILSSHVFEKDIVSCWGGDEFLIFCPDTTKDDALALAERLRYIIQNLMKKENEPIVTCSFGIAEYEDSSHLDVTYLKKVDQALYRAKRSGKNRIEVY